MLAFAASKTNRQNSPAKTPANSLALLKLAELECVLTYNGSRRQSQGSNRLLQIAGCVGINGHIEQINRLYLHLYTTQG